MKIVSIICTFLLIGISLKTQASTFSKDPIVLEVQTKYTSIEDALQAAKTTLLKQKFIAADGIQKTGSESERDALLLRCFISLLCKRNC